MTFCSESLFDLAISLFEIFVITAGDPVLGLSFSYSLALCFFIPFCTADWENPIFIATALVVFPEKTIPTVYASEEWNGMSQMQTLNLETRLRLLESSCILFI